MYPSVCTTTLMTKRSFATGIGWRRKRKAQAVYAIPNFFDSCARSKRNVT
jgi:hypothetical protein